MHLPDGLLNPATSATTLVVTAGALTYAVHRVRADFPRRKLSLAAAVGGCLFAAQMVNVPVTGDASGHLVGGVLAAILLGPAAAFLLMAAVLLVQCALFADGGITAWGANVLNLGGVSCLLALLVTRVRRGDGAAGLVALAGGTAWLATVAGAGLAALELAYGSHTLAAPYLATLLPVHLVVGLGEGLVTMLAVALLLALHPATIASRVRVGREGPPCGAVALPCGLLALMLATGAAPLASTLPDGLEWSLAQLGVAESSQGAALPAPLNDYRWPGLSAPLGTAAAGTLGVLTACALTGLVLGVSRKQSPPLGPIGAFPLR